MLGLEGLGSGLGRVGDSHGAPPALSLWEPREGGQLGRGAEYSDVQVLGAQGDLEGKQQSPAEPGKDLASVAWDRRHGLEKRFGGSGDGGWPCLKKQGKGSHSFISNPGSSVVLLPNQCFLQPLHSQHRVWHACWRHK